MKNKLLKTTSAIDIGLAGLAALAGAAGILALLAVLVITFVISLSGANGNLNLVLWLVILITAIPASAVLLVMGIAKLVLSIKCLKYSQNVNTVAEKKKVFIASKVLSIVFAVAVIILTIVYYLQSSNGVVILIIGSILAAVSIVNTVLMFIAHARNNKLIKYYETDNIQLV